MNRLSLLVISSLLLATGCAGPIQTRIETQSISAIPDQKQYAFTQTPEQQNEVYQAARKLVARGLATRGLSAESGGSILVHLGLADRPASIALTKGEEANLSKIADQKERKPFQSCKDREHRFVITMINRSNGGIIYSGSAAEHHCNGSLRDSLPHLVRGALSGFGSAVDAQPQASLETRRGVE